MCGRYALYGPQSRLREQFGVEPADLEERYNISPSQDAPIVRCGADGERELIPARWGLLPSWVKEPGKHAQPINAKVETAGQKPMFRHAFKRSRVLVPASGFYEWVTVAGYKQPYFIRPVGGEALFGFGGLLEHWEGPTGSVLTFAVLTTAANELMRPIHDRMPLIIRPEDYAAWLDPGVTEAKIVLERVGDYPSAEIEAYPVGRAVGNPRAQGSGLVRPPSI
ncbi:SOS response-associated peptidase [Thauera aminoaromatica]|uniref:Abasic site processing protein n=1 Tax=Thauera aminoaromatica TaxID=164330 RepID=A0A5C7SC26_THASP|nr:SOS response-associated peptidase [Thauera aminoaromatica]TXH81330.1 MAG: SOS response-associated peptidase [Thauera aminoaromatica]